MGCSGSERSGLLTAGGVLSIVGGVFEVFSGGIVVGLTITAAIRGELLPHLLPGVEVGLEPVWWRTVGVPVLVLGIIAVVGGVSAIRRKSFGLSLAGAICALPSSIFGILAIIFVALSKGEFEAQK